MLGYILSTNIYLAFALPGAGLGTSGRMMNKKETLSLATWNTIYLGEWYY